MPRKNEVEFLAWALQDNPDAIEMCRILFRISQTWDDLVDGDRQLSWVDVNNAFWECLVNLPANRFYRTFYDYFQPLLVQYITDWEDATHLETNGGDHGQNIAFVLRSSLGAIVSQCAFLIGGRDWLRKVSPHVRAHIFEDSLAAYKQELREKISQPETS